MLNGDWDPGLGPGRPGYVWGPAEASPHTPDAGPTHVGYAKIAATPATTIVTAHTTSMLTQARRSTATPTFS